jgi:type IV pilus assembly protein PilN
MARINLLPWRAERRKRRQNEFYGMLGAAALVAVLLAMLINGYYGAQIEGQAARNAYLQSQITTVDAQIKEIEELDKSKSRLLARKQVIEELQSSRSQMVHLFDELVRTIPDGIRLTSIQQAGDLLTLEGRTQSNARVSAYMRSIETSTWMGTPDLEIIEAKGDDKTLPLEFKMRVKMESPDQQDDQADADGSTKVGGAP